MEKVVGIIESVNPIKSGQGTSKDGRSFPWTLYEVMINGQKYSTFDSGYQKLIGQTKELEYEIRTNEGRNGVTYENRSLVTKVTQGGGQQSQALNEINRKLDRVLAILEKDEGPRDGDIPEEPNSSDDEIPIVEEEM